MTEYSPSKIIKDGNTYNFRDTTKIPLAGSNAISGSLVPSTDGTVNLGSSTAQWNNAYIKSLTINGVACGNILTHNASEFALVSDLSTVATSGSYNDLSNKPTIPTVNNATLTIQKNGTAVQTFTANQSTNATANIIVPTKTSDLTNDSNFVESSDLATVATSGSYTDLSDKPTIPTVNNATLTIQKNGTTIDTFTANASTDKTVNITVPTATSDLTNDSGFITSDNTKIPLAGSNAISGSLIPATTNAYDLGSASYQWNNAYIKALTINGVACGDILTHNTSEFVNVRSNQTIGGIKTFTDEVTMFGRDINLMSRLHYGKNSNPSSSTWQYVFFKGNTAAEGYTNAWYSGYLEQFLDTDGSARGRWLVRDTSENALNIDLYVDGNNKQVKPAPNNAVDLGTSTNKWKSLNGIAPDELGLPTSTYTDVSSYITNLDGVTPNTFTAPASGILYFDGNDTTVLYNSLFYANSVPIDNSGYRCTIPVTKGDTVTIWTRASQLGNVRIYHLKGKV